MRALILLLALTACAAEIPVLPDAGACSGACGPGTVCQSGQCVAADGGELADAADDVATDAFPNGCVSTTPGNCCGIACEVPPHAAVACVANRCAVASCDANFGDCNRFSGDGCEADLRTTDAHCGACGAVCAVGRRCVGGACVLPSSLDAGSRIDAGSDVPCSSDPRSDPANCGRCGNVCPGAPHAAPLCVEGVCASRCETGFLNCDNSVPGCEVDGRTIANCGGCGRACVGISPNAHNECVAGGCRVVCNANFGDCTSESGCETDLRTSRENCGRCNAWCGVTCRNGVCQ